MNFRLLILFFIAGSTAGFAQHTVEVTLSNIKVTTGAIRLALYGAEADFMKKPLASKELAVTANEMKVVFENLPPGEYAVTCYHDVNDNKQLDSNFMGVPKEPYGFSNNARGRFGPPAYDNARFRVKGNTKLSISLN